MPASLVSEATALAMKQSVRFASPTFLICSCLLLASIQAQSTQQQNHEEAQIDVLRLH
jgi:hypothetical protein